MVDSSPIPEDLESVDLILWIHGRQLAVVDLRPTPPADPPEEDPDTGEDTAFDLLDGGPQEPEDIVASNKGLSTGGCNTVGQYHGLLWLVSLLGLLTSRRTQCESDGC